MKCSTSAPSLKKFSFDKKNGLNSIDHTATEIMVKCQYISVISPQVPTNCI